MDTPRPTHYVAAPRGHGRTRALQTHEAFELSRGGLSLDDLITETAVSRGDQAEAAGPDGLVIAEPSWFPGADASPEEARRWLDEFSGWALSDDEDSEPTDEDAD